MAKVNRALFVALLIVLCVGMLYLVPRVYAIELPVTEIPTSSMQVWEDRNYTIHYIGQGERVYLGDHIDISGALQGNRYLAYFDGYDYNTEMVPQVIKLPDKKSGWYDYYIDPEIFGNRTGTWYKWNGKFESNANSLAFVVSGSHRNTTLTFPNGTVINQSAYLSGEYAGPVPSPTPKLLPEKRESDYLVTTEEPFNITVSGISALWLFNGDDNSILYSTNGTSSQLIFNKTSIGMLEPGNYQILIQSISNLTPSFDVVYNTTDKQIRWFDRKVFGVRSINTTNMVPEIAIRTLKEVFPQTFDTYVVKRVSVQRPEITIVQMSQVSAGSAKEYYHDSNLRGNVTLMDVRGYTNVLPGTNITVILDEKTTDPRLIPKLTIKTNAQGDYLGDWRVYRAYVPLYWDSMAVGMHTLTARTALGGEVFADFPVSVLPNDSFVPSPTVKWVDDRNPWVPTPTPQIVKEVTRVVVTQTIMVPVTPAPEVIFEQQKKAVDASQGELIFTAGIWLLGGLGVCMVIGLVIWGMRIHRRVKDEQEREKEL